MLTLPKQARNIFSVTVFNLWASSMCDCDHLHDFGENLGSTAASAPQDISGVSLGRRSFLFAGGGALTLAALPFSEAMANVSGSLALNIRNQRTGEALRVAWIRNGQVDQQALLALHLLSRDWREKRATKMDVKLYLILSYIQHSVGLDKQIILTSGYRTSETNKKIRGAAPKSYHIRGQALDFTVAGVPINTVRDLAQRLRLGGVGYYPKNNYVHIDTGPVRQWQS